MSRAPLQQLETRPSWPEVVAEHYRFTSAECEHRYRIISELFKVMAPWLDYGIEKVMERHYLILSEDLLLSRLFAQAARRNELHATSGQFMQWLEAYVLTDLADPSNRVSAPRATYGAPDARLQYHFNQLSFYSRSVLFCFMVKAMSYEEVAEHFSITLERSQKDVMHAWRDLIIACPHVRISRNWQTPTALQFSEVKNVISANA